MHRRLRGPLGLALALPVLFALQPGGALAAGDDGHPHGPNVVTAGDPHPRTDAPAPAASAPEKEAAPAAAASEAKKDEPKWDVSKPPGEWGFHDVAIDTDEGTWMSVDVSP